MNKTILIGRLTKDIELKAAGNTQVGRFGIAVDRKYKKEGGPTADFLNCVAFGKTAEVIQKYFHKGNRIGIVGHIQTDSYEKDGTKHYTTDIIVDEIEFIESKNSGSSNTDSDGFQSVEGKVDEDLPFI